MFSDTLIITVRNIFLLQLAVLALAPERYEVVCLTIARFWKSLQEAAQPKKYNVQHKGKGFWEIDMTKFEP